MTLIAPIEADLEREGEREGDLEVFSHPHPLPLLVFFLSLPETPEVEWHVSTIGFVSSTH